MKEEEQAALDKFVTLAKSKDVPPHLCEGLGRYVLFGIFPGSFLIAFMSHDFHGVMSYGDDMSIAGLKPTRIFVFNNLPIACRGSEKNMFEWSLHAKEVGAVELIKLVGNC